jgi:hypothetical protein
LFHNGRFTDDRKVMIYARAFMDMTDYVVARSLGLTPDAPDLRQQLALDRARRRFDRMMRDARREEAEAEAEAASPPQGTV